MHDVCTDCASLMNTVHTFLVHHKIYIKYGADIHYHLSIFYHWPTGHTIHSMDTFYRITFEFLHLFFFFFLNMINNILPFHRYVFLLHFIHHT